MEQSSEKRCRRKEREGKREGTYTAGETEKDIILIVVVVVIITLAAIEAVERKVFVIKVRNERHLA